MSNETWFVILSTPERISYCNGLSCFVDVYDEDFLVVKYSPGGIQQWFRIYNGVGFSTDNLHGMKVDKKGNVYESGPGGIWIISPEGKHLGTIVTPEMVANLGFGDTDGKTLFILARRGLYKIRVNGEGIHPQISMK